MFGIVGAKLLAGDRRSSDREPVVPSAQHLDAVIEVEQLVEMCRFVFAPCSDASVQLENINEQRVAHTRLLDAGVSFR